MPQIMEGLYPRCAMLSVKRVFLFRAKARCSYLVKSLFVRFVAGRCVLHLACSAFGLMLAGTASAVVLP